MAEAVSGVRICAHLLTESQYLFTGMGCNPLNSAYYACGLAFLFSALAYAPLRKLSSWETRRYLSKRALSTRPSTTSAHSALADEPNDMSNLQVKQSEFLLANGTSATTPGEIQLPINWKASVSNVC